MEFLISKSATGYHSHLRAGDTEKLVEFLFFIFLHRFLNSMVYLSFRFVSFHYFYLSFAFTRRIHTKLSSQTRTWKPKNAYMKPNSLNTIVNEAKHTTVMCFAWSKNCVCWDIVKIASSARMTKQRAVYMFFLYLMKRDNPKRTNAFGRDTSRIQDEKGQVHLL